MAKKNMSGNSGLAPKDAPQNYSGYKTMPAAKPKDGPSGGAPVIKGSGRKAAGVTYSETRASYPKQSDGKPGGAVDSGDAGGGKKK